tara:strand:+ start:459 stop:590 length:132 start_codon:yes stop_codon:yes gene_type:complete
MYTHQLTWAHHMTGIFLLEQEEEEEQGEDIFLQKGYFVFHIDV